MRRVPYARIKNEVLGKEYDLSVAFLSAREMRVLTLRTKHKDKVSNVLAFPLSKNSGEVVLCRPAVAPFSTGFLFIHGLLHLRGLGHGVTMEHEERRILKRFGLRVHE